MRNFEIKGHIYVTNQPITRFETVVSALDRSSAERLVKSQYAGAKVTISTVADRGPVKK
jgi:hypothetical protein